MHPALFCTLRFGKKMGRSNQEGEKGKNESKGMKEVRRAAVFRIQGQDHKSADQAHDLSCPGSCFKALYGLPPDYVTPWLKRLLFKTLGTHLLQAAFPD